MIKAEPVHEAGPSDSEVEAVLTPSSDLDDHVAVENSAASQSLGGVYRINRLISHTQFRTQACTR